MEHAARSGRLSRTVSPRPGARRQRCLQRTRHYVRSSTCCAELLDIDGGDFACLLPRFGLGATPGRRDQPVAGAVQGRHASRRCHFTPSACSRTPWSAPACSARRRLRSACCCSPCSTASCNPAAGTRVVATADSPRTCRPTCWSGSDLPANGRAEPPGGRRQAESAPDPLLDQYAGPLPEARARHPIVGRDGDPPVRRHPPCAMQGNPILVGAPSVSRPRWSKAWPCASPPASAAVVAGR